MSKNMPAKSGEQAAPVSFQFNLSKQGEKFQIRMSEKEFQTFLEKDEQGLEKVLYSCAYMAVHHPRGKAFQTAGAITAEEIFSRIGTPGRATVDPVVAAWARKRLKVAELEGWEAVEEVVKSKYGKELSERSFNGLVALAIEIGID
jgi:hypothetical protein